MYPVQRPARLIFLTTLIDLLVQVVFLFMLLLQDQSTQFMSLQEIKEMMQEIGVSVPKLKDNWRKLLNIDDFEKAERAKRIELEEDNQRLRSEIEKLKEAQASRGGRDLPPCWTDENKQPIFILDIEIQEAGLWVRRQWPETKTNEAQALGLAEMELDRLFTPVEFKRRFQHLRNNPQCRHYVFVSDTPGTSKRAYQNQLLIVESIFYKKLFFN